jgi:hypothetical protein
MKRYKVLFVVISTLCLLLPTILSAQMTWTCATDSAEWSARSGHTSVVFDNKMWVIGGNDVWYSSDGSHWTQATVNAGWSARGYHTSVTFDNKIWVIGGSDTVFPNYRNDVWYSLDGINWTQASDSAGWSARYLHSAVVFSNKIWVMGGWHPRSGAYNDAWYSTDGINWSQACSTSQWSTRYNHTSVVYDNKMWLIGGTRFGLYPAYRDVWYSTDGLNWTQATDSAEWSARCGHTSVVFNNKMWVIGGFDHDSARYYNDVWYSTGLGIEEECTMLDVTRKTMEIYPNPAKNYLTIRYPLKTQGSMLQLFDISGKIVKSEELKGKNYRISLDGIKNGVYFVKVDNNTQVTKIIVTK